MEHFNPIEVTGFHSCDKQVGVRVLNGEMALLPSRNSWDWLGHGIYFWEQNPWRALEYAIDSASGRQFNKRRIKIPYVLGTAIDLGNCLNLLEPGSLLMVAKAYKWLERIYTEADREMPINSGARRELDCTVIKCAHEMRKKALLTPYDTVRSAFHEGKELYPTAPFTSQLHIQICVINSACIKGYFLPLPLEKYNPYLKRPLLPDA